MTIKDYNEHTKTWKMGARYTARTTEEIDFARELYEQRIKELEWYIRYIQQGGAQ